MTRIGHYPGSVRGEGLARALSAQLGTVAGIATPEVSEEPLLRSNQCALPGNCGLPAIDRHPARAPADTLFLNDICRQLLLGIAIQEGAALTCPMKFRVNDAPGKPVRKAWITIDNLLKYRVDPWGEVSLPGLDAGTHNVQVEAPGFQPANSSMELKSGIPALTKVFTLTANR